MKKHLRATTGWQRKLPSSCLARGKTRVFSATLVAFSVLSGVLVQPAYMWRFNGWFNKSLVLPGRQADFSGENASSQWLNRTVILDLSWRWKQPDCQNQE